MTRGHPGRLELSHRPEKTSSHQGQSDSGGIENNEGAFWSEFGNCYRWHGTTTGSQPAAAGVGVYESLGVASLQRCRVRRTVLGTRSCLCDMFGQTVLLLSIP